MLGSLLGKSGAPLSEADRWALALSSMYTCLDGGRDDRLAPFGALQRQKSWNMLRQNWGVDGVTRRKKHDQSRTTLDWLQGSGHRSELADPNDVEAFRDLFAWDVARLVMWPAMRFMPDFSTKMTPGRTSGRWLGRPSGITRPGSNTAAASPAAAAAG